MIKKTLYAVFFGLIATSIFASGSSDGKPEEIQSSSRPEWIVNPNASYDNTSYLVGVGSAKTRSDAENEAVTSLAKVINQSIQAEENTQQSFSSTSEGVSTYLSTIKTSTDITGLVGVSIKENWTSPDGVEYALAVLNRSESGQFYRNKIEDNNSSINELIALAKNDEGSFSSCSKALKAYELAKENDYFLSLLAIIKPIYSKTTTFDYGSSNSLAQKVSDLLSKINVVISIKGDTDDRIEAAFAEVFASLGIHTFNQKENAKNINYTLNASVSYEPLTVSDSKISFVRYNIKSEIIENSSGKNILPWNKNARVGKLTEQDAMQAAIRSVEKAIREEYLNNLSKTMN